MRAREEWSNIHDPRPLHIETVTEILLSAAFMIFGTRSSRNTWEPKHENRNDNNMHSCSGGGFQKLATFCTDAGVQAGSTFEQPAGQKLQRDDGGGTERRPRVDSQDGVEH